jgi:hypothetical protein
VNSLQTIEYTAVALVAFLSGGEMRADWDLLWQAFCLLFQF